MGADCQVECTRKIEDHPERLMDLFRYSVFISGDDIGFDANVSFPECFCVCPIGGELPAHRFRDAT